MSKTLSCYYRWLILGLLAGFSILAVVIPPGKAYDEQDHIRRAYFLSQGKYLLRSLSCVERNYWCRDGLSMSGEIVDGGLFDYLRKTAPNVRTRETHEADRVGKAVGWTGEEVFNVAPGTGYYFPLIYAPQAAGFGLGKTFNFSVYESYQLGRVLNFGVSLIVLVAAFTMFTPLPAVILLFVLPLSMFQAVSAGIDFSSLAWSMLAISCFLTIEREPPKRNLLPFLLMGLSIVLVSSSRAHLAPMMLMMFHAAWVSRRIFPWLLAVLSTVIVLAWMFVAIPSTRDYRRQRDQSTAEVAMHYLDSPSEALGVLWRTFSDRGLMGEYLDSFFGMIPWAPLPDSVYKVIPVMMGVVLVLSLAGMSQWRGQWKQRVMLFVMGMLAVLLTFLSMLLTWTPYPAVTVDGVQGRYFLAPIMLLLTAVCGWEVSETLSVRTRVSLILTMLCFFYSLLVLIMALLRGFYL